MNFLAHIQLSGDEYDLLAGNYLGDFVAKKEYELLPKSIQQGVELHRAIDLFTDQHEITKDSNKLLSGQHGKYAAVLSDIFYDHFLALHWGKFHEKPLQQFATETYHLLGTYMPYFPDRAKSFYQYMCHYNILFRYKELEGIHQVLQGMASRSRFGKHMANGVDTLTENYSALEENFLRFYPLLEKHCMEIRIGK